MTTRGQVNSNFYQIVNVDSNANPTQVKPEYITQVSPLSDLTVTGNITSGNIHTGMISANGNITAPLFIGNVLGNISGNFVVPGSNTDIIYNNQGNAGASDSFQFISDNNSVKLSGTLNAGAVTGDGSGLYNINVGNISGLGNIAFVNLDGNSGNILYGNGVFAAVPNTSYSNNSNFANFAGTAFNVSGSNVSGDVSGANHANISDVANSVAGANVSGYVANASHATVADSANSVTAANVSGLGNVALTNYNGNGSQALLGNGTWGPVGGTPGGSNTNIQFNNNGNFSGSNTFTFTNTSNLVTIANLQIHDNGNANSELINFTPDGNTFSLTGNSRSWLQITDYGSQAAGSKNLNMSFIKARGNASNPTTAQNNDQMFRLYNHVYNGNTYPTSSIINAYAPNAATYSNSSVTYTPGVVLISTGNPNGNLIATTASGSQTSTWSWDQFGRMVAQQSTYNPSGFSAIFQSYGTASDGSGSSGTIQIIRQRGNLDAGANLPVQNNDGIGGLHFYANTGSGVSDAGQIYATVDTTYGPITSGNATPMRIDIVTRASNNSSYDWKFGGDGNLTLPTNTSSINYANGSPYGGGTYGNSNVVSLLASFGSNTITTTGNISAGSVNSNLITSGQINLNQTSAGNPFLSINGSQTNQGSFNLNDSTMFVSQSSNIDINSLNTYRTRGNRTSQLPAANGDAVMAQNYLFYSDVGNLYAVAATQSVDIIHTDQAGNYSVTFSSSVSGNNESQYNIYAPSINLNGNALITSNLQVNGIIQPANATQLSLNDSSSGSPTLSLNGTTSNVAILSINQGSFQVFNTDLGGGFSPFEFTVYGNNGYQEPINISRIGGTQSSPADAPVGTSLLNWRWQLRANGSIQDQYMLNTTYDGYTPGVGAYGTMGFTTSGGADSANSTFHVQGFGSTQIQNNLSVSGNVSAGSFFQYPVYTASALNAITGSVGWTACVTDSGGGGNPNGMIAFWDTTHSRWSYIHDNSAV